MYPYCAPALAIGSALIAYQKSTASKCFQPFPGIISDHSMPDAQQQIAAYVHYKNLNLPQFTSDPGICKPVVLYGKGQAQGRVITKSRTEHIETNVAT